MVFKGPGTPLQKILLVDDDKAFINLNRAVLKYSEVKCHIDDCRNGKEALDYMTSTDQKPDVILLDIDMPVMNGLEFLEQLKCQTSFSQPKVFMLSSSCSDHSKNTSLQYPFVKGFFEKPLKDNDIKEILSLFQ
jgi:CheY-like chemotaxis protein